MPTVLDEPSLRQAKRRSQHGANRLGELNAQVAAFGRASAASQIRVYLPSDAFETGEFQRPTFDWSGTMPLESRGHIELLASEVVHHLRVALDYFAFQLCWLDSGGQQDYTSFPICDTRAQWNKAKRDNLPGVTTEHRDALALLQPFNGCEWTGELRDLSNPDKHRYLSEVSRNLVTKFQLSESLFVPDPRDENRIVATFPADTSVEFEGGVEVVPLLTRLTREVARTLIDHQSWFGESDSVTFSD